MKRLVLPLAAALLLASAVPAADKPKAKDTKATAADDGKDWKVDGDHGPSHTIAFTTDQATWMPLDVSPDGGKIVFSLVGDLYTLPIGGGTATRITSGAGYDVQPRFSPDGKWIAFASDRGGIENLWICDLEGKRARQVSTEKDSTVNGPAWSPDGLYLVGRKRLTDQSSLGTVEIWMWHVRGGSGIQLTKKDEQPDAADPTFGKDGRFLYVSARDARYRYDRNVNEGIWQIKRLDRWNGQLIPITGEFGGAATPAISPDGKTLAYVRRIRAVTVLEVMDLATGKIRQVATGLTRDNQEGFAFHGVFPGYAWTPDGKSIVTTAGGGIVKYDVANGSSSKIPFTASVEQKLTESLHTPRRVGEGDVRARIIRWPVESPDGKTLVFSALGHIYSMDLPSGTPKRLTSGDDLEYAPAFSRDGRTLAYVTWNDADGGQVKSMTFPGGTSRTLTQVPGQYANPSFSPDGTKVAYVSGSGATFRDGDPADELWEEIRWIPAGGGESHYVVGTKNRGTNRRMPRPQWSADNERIYFIEDGDPAGPGLPPKTNFVSIKPDGTDKRTHVRFTAAEEAALSPDGRWLAISEQYNAYVTALPPLGAQTVDIELGGAALPLGQLTDEGGEWVGWADGGKTITWIWGPTYHRISFDKALPEPSSDDDKEKKKDEAKKDDKDKKDDGKKKMPESTAIEIALSVPRAKPTGAVAYTGAGIVTMKGDEVIADGTIIVDGDRIVAVGPRSSTKAPSGAQVVDVAGKTIIPGLFDEHAHLHYSTLDIFPQKPWKYAANLAYGVTTTHDPSASNQEVFGQSEMVEAGIMTGPRIFSTGFILYGANLPGRALINSLDDARRHLRRLKSLGAFSVKSYMQPRREARQWILKAAREEGMLVVPEGGGDLEMDMTMVLDGHTTIEHALPMTPLRKDIVELLAKSGTSYTPTLLVAYGGISGDKWFHQHYEMWKDERLQKFVPQSVVDGLGRIRGIMATDPADWHHIDVAASAKDVMHAGGRVCLGGHGQMQGLGPHWEMWAFVQGGMTPLEAIRVATLYPAETLGMAKDLGSIEAGKLADFVVLDKNPLEKIENSETVVRVVKNGRSYLPDDLKRVPR